MKSSKLLNENEIQQCLRDAHYLYNEIEKLIQLKKYRYLRNNYTIHGLNNNKLDEISNLFKNIDSKFK